MFCDTVYQIDHCLQCCLQRTRTQALCCTNTHTHTYIYIKNQVCCFPTAVKNEQREQCWNRQITNFTGDLFGRSPELTLKDCLRVIVSKCLPPFIDQLFTHFYSNLRLEKRGKGRKANALFKSQLLFCIKTKMFKHNTN